MDTQNSQTSTTPSHSASGRVSTKTLLSALAIILLLLAIGGSYYAFTKQKLGSGSASVPGQDDGSLPSYTFAGTQYLRVSTLPSQKEGGLASESYEWAPKGESVTNWTSLITTHKISPTSATTTISAKVYAENAAAMNQKQGAVIIETSVINTPDAIKEAGIDPKNPPYLLVYAYPSNGTSSPIEVDMQKVVNGPDGSVEAFIYAFPLTATTEQEVNTFFQSDTFKNTRIEVIKASFPY